MKQIKCDNCGKTDPNAINWLRLSRPYDPPAPQGYVILPGYEEYDFCTPTCAVAFLEKEESDA